MPAPGTARLLSGGACTAPGCGPAPAPAPGRAQAPRPRRGGAGRAGQGRTGQGRGGAGVAAGCRPADRQSPRLVAKAGGSAAGRPAGTPRGRGAGPLPGAAGGLRRGIAGWGKLEAGAAAVAPQGACVLPLRHLLKLRLPAGLLAVLPPRRWSMLKVRGIRKAIASTPAPGALQGDRAPGRSHLQSVFPVWVRSYSSIPSWG